MKKFIIAVVAIAVGFVQANAMSHERAQAEALFLTDKMAYELNLTNAQYDAVYEINYDYFVSLVGTSDILGIFWNRRERELEWVLTSRQYRAYLSYTYFYKPVVVYNTNMIRFAIYDHYAHNLFYRPVRKVYHNYIGGYHYKAPAHKGHVYAHNVKPAPAPKPGHGNVAPAHKPDNKPAHKPGNVAPNNGGNHKPGNVAPNNGGNKPGKVTPNNGGNKPANKPGNVTPNNGGNHKPANVAPRGNTTRSTGVTAAPRASKNAPARTGNSTAVRARSASNAARR